MPRQQNPQDRRAPADHRALRERRTVFFRRRLIAAAAGVCLIVAIIVTATFLARGGNPENSSPSSTSMPVGTSLGLSQAAANTSAAPVTTVPVTAVPVTTVPATPSAVTSGPITPAQAKQIGANELGRIPVLMFHLIGTGKSHLTPEQFRFDIHLLRQHGFYPTTIREMVEGTMDIPAGRTPVVLTFDDSSPGQYRILADGTLDPECAVGILQAEVDWGIWASRATFFPLLEVNGSNILWGQPDLAQTKLRNLVEWGYEIGSHGLTHMDFSQATAEKVRKELAGSQAQLEELIGSGYEVFTLSPPYGEYPDDRSLLLSGEYQGRHYNYSAVVMAWGESSPSPFSSEFDVTRIPRITAAAPEAVKKLMKYWKTRREFLYISDGDPETVSYPADAPAELGKLRADIGQRVVEY
jgi:hypothetical protein